jgi:hypothetical protein
MKIITPPEAEWKSLPFRSKHDGHICEGLCVHGRNWMHLCNALGTSRPHEAASLERCLYRLLSHNPTINDIDDVALTWAAPSRTSSALTHIIRSQRVRH